VVDLPLVIRLPRVHNCVWDCLTATTEDFSRDIEVLSLVLRGDAIPVLDWRKCERVVSERLSSEIEMEHTVMRIFSEEWAENCRFGGLPNCGVIDSVDQGGHTEDIGEEDEFLSTGSAEMSSRANRFQS
jgi:hypothetical protein